MSQRGLDGLLVAAYQTLRHDPRVIDAEVNTLADQSFRHRHVGALAHIVCVGLERQANHADSLGSMLQQPIEGVRAPVEFSTLDTDGMVLASHQLIDDSATVNWVSRVAFDDRSFLLYWTAEDSCPDCRTLYAQH